MSEHERDEHSDQNAGTENQDEYDNEDAALEEEEEEESKMVFRNHDLVGIEGIIRAQKNEIEKKKVRSNICLLTVTVVGAEDRKREVLPRASRTGKHGPAVYLQSAR